MKARGLAFLIAGAWLAAAAAWAQPEGPVVRVDPALDALVAPDAQLTRLHTGFGFTEGITWVDKGGYLLLSDIPANVIYKLTPTGAVSVFLHPAGYKGFDFWRVGREQTNGRDPSDPAFEKFIFTGSNGLALDPQGRLVITAMADRTVTRLEKDGKRTVLAGLYEGKRLSGPNDVVVKSDGAVYFTDSVNGLRGGVAGRLRELLFNGVYRVKDGSITLLDSDKDRPDEFPNGIAFSPDEKYLYVTAGFGKTLRLGGVARRQHRQCQGLYSGRQRRHEGRLERESLFAERSRSRRGLDYVAGGQASGHAATASGPGRTAATHL